MFVRAKNLRAVLTQAARRRVSSLSFDRHCCAVACVSEPSTLRGRARVSRGRARRLASTAATDNRLQVVCDSLSSPLILSHSSEPASPSLAPDDVVVEVRACGVNFKDTLQCVGKYQQKLDVPFVPGSECAGVVVAVGNSVQNLAIGDRVASMAPNAFQKYHTAPERLLFKMPTGEALKKAQSANDSAIFEEAASLLCTHGTALLALQERTNVQPGETVLVTAAGGGVGLAAVGLAKSLGATVIAAASSDEKLDLAKSHGADHVVKYDGTASNLRDECDAITNGKGVDVAIDMCGGDVFKAAFKALGWGGRVCIIGFASGDIPAVALGKRSTLRLCELQDCLRFVPGKFERSPLPMDGFGAVRWLCFQDMFW